MGKHTSEYEQKEITVMLKDLQNVSERKKIYKNNRKISKEFFHNSCFILPFSLYLVLLRAIDMKKKSKIVAHISSDLLRNIDMDALKGDCKRNK